MFNWPIKSCDYGDNTRTKNLMERNDQILFDRLLLWKNFHKIAEEYGVSSSRARQIFEKKFRILIFRYQKFSATADKVKSLESELAAAHNLNQSLIRKLKVFDAQEEIKNSPFSRYVSEKMNEPIDDHPFSVRQANVFKNDGMVSLGDICTKTDSYLLRIPNFGKKSLMELKEYLSSIGLSTGMSDQTENMEQYQ